MDTATNRIQIDVHVNQSDPQETLDLLKKGLECSPPWIPSQFFYDDAGSRLFETICTLPEYYQTRTEFALLQSLAPRIVQVTGAQDLVELGSGAAFKTRAILDAMDQVKQLKRYVPFDVNEMIVKRSAQELCTRYPELEVHGVIGHFLHHLQLIPEGTGRLFVFLGGTIGNFNHEDAVEFLTELQETMDPGDSLLLGTDLIKDRTVLEAAYNDSRGVTAAFNKNILRAINTLTGSDFDPVDFKHVAFFNQEEHRIEMWLQATRNIHATLPALNRTFSLKAGEALRTEISTKYNRELVQDLYRASGLHMSHWYTDDDNTFALSTARMR